MSKTRVEIYGQHFYEFYELISTMGPEHGFRLLCIIRSNCWLWRAGGALSKMNPLRSAFPDSVIEPFVWINTSRILFGSVETMSFFSI